MAVRKNASKTSKKASVDFSKLSDVRVDKKTKNATERVVKSTSAKVWLIAFVFLLIGVCLGVGAWWFVCRNDCFDLIGQENVVLTLEESYIDEGVKIVAFGKDESESFVIETNLKIDESGNFYSDEVGQFYIKYSSTNFKYGKLFKVEKVRIITFVEVSEGGE